MTYNNNTRWLSESLRYEAAVSHIELGFWRKPYVIRSHQAIPLRRAATCACLLNLSHAANVSALGNTILSAALPH